MPAFARILAALAVVLVPALAAGCAARPAAPVQPDELVLPHEAVPPGVRPMSRELEEMGSQ